MVADLGVFMAIAMVFLLASLFFFLISEGDNQAFAVDQSRVGLLWRAFD